MKNLSKVLMVLIVGLFATQAAAQDESNGYPITDVNLRAGPGTEYPVLVTVPTDAPITILGCVEDFTWCDTVFEEYRGWMRSIYLAGYYDGEYYLLSDYAPDLGYQVVTFDRAAYWDSYYQDEPFYNDQYRVTEARGAGWVDDGVFYDRLAPHGAWTWTQGQYVWVPTGVDASWRPYTRGRWIYTDYGWTWDSYEPFGWATYHYGRWGFSNRIGWFWVPGNRWGPAWVSWRQSDDYLAWAPLPPAYERGGIGINVSFGNVPGYYWSVVPSLYFLSDDLPRHYVRDRARWRSVYDRTRPIGHTTIVNNSVVNNVVNVNYVERHTNTTVVERRINRTRDWDRAGKVRGDTYEVYRPGLQEGRNRRTPNRPRQFGEVASLSKTRALARGESATDELLAPPEVREALKKRQGGKVRGGPSGPGDFSRAEPEGRKFDRRLPKGRDAEGPPPSIKKARAQPVPAQTLGRSRGALDLRSDKRGPPKQKAKSDDKKGPPKQKAKSDDKKGPPKQKAKSDDKKGPPKQKAKSDDEKGPPKQKAKSDDKKGSLKQKAKSDDKNGGPQARSRAAPKKAPPKEKAVRDDKKKPKPSQAKKQQAAKPKPAQAKKQQAAKPKPAQAKKKQAAKPKPSQAKKQQAAKPKSSQAKKKQAVKPKPAQAKKQQTAKKQSKPGGNKQASTVGKAKSENKKGKKGKAQK